MEDQAFPIELPRTDAPKRKENDYSYQGRLLGLMNKYGYRDADVVKGAPIPASTWHDWICGNVSVPVVDENLLNIVKFFNTTLEWLLFGVGEENRLLKAI